MGHENGDREEVYWRDKRVSDRLGFALENDKLYKDVHFIVGKNEVRISAHKLILRLSSLVFENLITAHEEKGIDEILLPNTTPNMFTKLLKFIYTDELEMYDMLNFLEVARDFGFKKLPEQSIRVLKKTEIDVDNAVFILEIAKGLGDDELVQSSLSFIYNNAKPVLNSETFLKLSYASLCQILKDDQLATDELTIFQAVIKWAEHQCNRSQVPICPETLREVLKEARLFIRYTQMGYDQVLSEVKPTGILLSSELMQVLRYYVDPSITLHNMPSKPRAVRANMPQKPIRAEQVAAKSLTSNSRLHPSSLLPVEHTEIDRTKEFRMQSLFIDFRDLINVIQLRLTLTKIILHDVVLKNAECYKGKRVFLPNLESFYFYQKKDEPDVASILPDKTFMRGLTTKEFLFFEKDRIVPWKFNNLWSLGVDICVDIKGLKLIEIEPNTGKNLTLSYPIQSEAEQILEGLTSEIELKSLCLTALSITDREDGCVSISAPEAFDQCAESLETLVLQGVEFKNSVTATGFLNKFTNLKNLSVFIANGITINFQFDLIKQRNSLQRLSLAKVNFGTYKKKKAVVPFSMLEELYLDVCAWPPALCGQASTMFPKLKTLVLRTKGNCRCSAVLFADFLEIPTLQKMVIYRYPGKEDTFFSNPNLNIFLPPAGVNKTSVHHFLVKAGVEFTSTGNHIPDFVLAKDISTGVWNVVHDNTFDEIHFQASMLDVFFADLSVSKLIE